MRNQRDPLTLSDGNANVQNVMSGAENTHQKKYSEMIRVLIFEAISKERTRQHEKFGDQCIAGNLHSDTKLRILVEEVGEVAQAIDGHGDLRSELVQVAACAVGWLESLH